MSLFTDINEVELIENSGYLGIISTDIRQEGIHIITLLSILGQKMQNSLYSLHMFWLKSIFDSESFIVIIGQIGRILRDTYYGTTNLKKRR